MRRPSASAPAVTACFLLVTALTGCASPSTRPRAPDFEQLYNAIAVDDVEYVRAVIKAGLAGPDQRIPAPGYLEGTPLLTVAAKNASLSVLRYLIGAGANVNARTPVNETALMLSSFFHEDDGQGARTYERHEKAARLLVQAGADLENDPGNYTALAYAAYRGHDRIVRFLLESGARVDADAQGGVAGIATPLMMAAMMGYVSTARLLLRAGANPGIRVYGGLTARELAEKYNQTQLVPDLSCAESLAPGESFAGKCGMGVAGR